MTMEQILEYPFTGPPAPGTTVEVVSGVHWLRMPLPFALDHINLWLLEDDGGFVIVDCGIGSEATRTLWDQVIAGKIGDRPVGRVIATHCHPDHIGNGAWLGERFGATVWMSQADYLSAHAWRDDAAGFTTEALIALFLTNGLDAARLDAFRKRGNAYRKLVPELPRRYHRIMDRDEIRIGGRAWQVVMGYGHAPEHASLWCEEAAVLISGDMLLPRISTNVSVSSVAPSADPLALFLRSLATLAGILPAHALVLPSHGMPFRGAHQRIAQLDQHHEERLAELEAACDTPKSAADVIGTLFRRPLDTHQTFFAMGETLAHLNYLLARNRVSRSVGADGVARFVRSSAAG